MDQQMTEINSKSLWYRLATTYGGLSKHTEMTDSCTYLKSICTGIVYCALIVLMGGLLIGLALLDVVLWVVAMLVYGVTLVPNDGAMITLAMLGAVMIMVVLWMGKGYVQKRAMHLPEPVYLIKQQFKDKLCVQMRIK